MALEETLIANNSSLKNEMDYLEQVLLNTHRIDPNLYEEYDVKRGLRDSNGKGVLTGLTEVSDVCGFDVINGRKIPAEGSLYYQGINVNDLVHGLGSKKFGFEETIFLLLFGRLPKEEELKRFLGIMFELEALSGRFVRDVVMKASNSNIMNAMQRCILTLYTYDDNPEDISVENVLRQSLELIAKMPLIAVYSYHAYRHFRKDETLLIRNPEKGRSLAENLLLMLRPNGQYTELEAKVLDIALVLHAEHGGGNNSTFTTHVVTSSGTDTYSSTAASIGSLKGPRHGGANLKAQKMFDDIKASVKDWDNEDEIRLYLHKILNKEAFDHSGLIYGMGHAVYTLSDPREKLLKSFAEKLAKEKGLENEFSLYDRVERLAKEEIMTHRKMFKPVCANVDFYSGFVYTMLGIPEELFTPIFAIARIAGWSAHRLEELLNAGKIIRPAYKYVGHHTEFHARDERE
ncbi:citrate/2-methylcitrate synthase [[Ruminococcus] lactaris]